MTIPDLLVLILLTLWKDIEYYRRGVISARGLDVQLKFGGEDQTGAP